VVVTGGGTGLTYEPNANYCNFPGGAPSDDFNYTLNGGSTASVSMTVDCVNDAPVAVDDSKTVTEDAAATSIDVLANDTDLEGDAIGITDRSQATHGNVVITGGGTGLTYRPNANYCGPDSFTYTVNGGDTATVSVTVTCVDDAPEAVGDSKTVTEDASATSIDVLANDTDVEGDAITVTAVGTADHGTVAKNSDGSGLTYQPNANYCGPDSFQYTVNSGDTAQVSITVDCVNDAPDAVDDDNETVSEDAPATAIDVLANDSDIEGDAITISSASDPTHGTVVLTGGTAGARTGLTYQPDQGYCSDPSSDPTDDFTYTLNGGKSATVAVTVDCSQPPNAVNDNATVPQNALPTSIPVLANDLDPDGGAPIWILSRTQPANGNVVITGSGTGVTYQPNSGYCNTTSGTLDTFTYTLNGGSPATVFMSVTCPATSATPQQVAPTSPATTKCKKGFKKVKGKCKKKKRKRK
jgi:Bacterial Ig domain/Bacterial cadherin-like domain